MFGLGRAARVRPNRERPLRTPPHQPTVVHALAAAAEQSPERVALRLLASKGEPEILTFADLWRDARRFGARLGALGVTPGAPVVLMLPPGRDFVAAFFGVQLAGGTPTPLAPPFRLDNAEPYLASLAPILADSQADTVITSAAIAPYVEAAALGRCVVAAEFTAAHPDEHSLALPEPEHTAVLQYSSGPCGEPRGIRLSHRAVMANIQAIGSALKLTPDDVAVSWLPMFADMGLIGMLLSGIVWRFEHCAMTPEAFLLRPARWLDAITTFRATLSCAPNFAYKLAARRVRDEDLAKLDLSCWRVALIGAEAIDGDVVDAFQERFAPAGLRPRAMVATYGLAENALAVTLGTPGEGLARRVIDGEPVVSSGRPMVGQEVGVFSSLDRPVAPGSVGEIRVRSATLMDGYHRAPAATALTMRGGWLHTGDLGALIDGEIYVTGRLKPMVIKRGRNFYAADIEGIAARAAGLPVDAVVAFASANRDAGTEDVVVMVERPEALDADALSDAAAEINAALLQGLGIRADQLVLLEPGTMLRGADRDAARRACQRRHAHAAEVAA
jgi:acyl-CoA synthetase (AMP-forming)/AMP-acid ligase II